MKKTKPLIGITMGDPSGVGPELVAHLMERGEQSANILVIGDADILQAAGDLIDWTQKIERVSSAAEAREVPAGKCAVLDLGIMSYHEVKPGVVDAQCGRASVAGIKMSADLVAAGEIDAVASAPVNKVSMNLAGEHYPGQTEMYLESWGMTPEEGHIMLIGGEVRCSLVTAHCSMQEALDRMVPERIERIALQANKTLITLFGVTKPTIGVAGMNCHAGDGGLFGREEIEVINPMAQQLRENGLDITDAQPADALFYAAEQGRYDVVLGMYHDQGVIPLKRYGYVTVIAGAPHIRTTCGHGTAFDIAWQGKVRPDLFLRAVDLAADLAGSRIIG